MLEDLGCSVVLAEDGGPAVAHARNERFRTPSSWTARCRNGRLRRHRGHPARRAAAWPGAGSDRRADGERDEPRSRALCRIRMTSFLAKPFKAAQLLEVLEPISRAKVSCARCPPARTGVFLRSCRQPPRPRSRSKRSSLLSTPPCTPYSRPRRQHLEHRAPAGAGPRPGQFDPRPRQAMIFERLCEMLFASRRTRSRGSTRRSPTATSTRSPRRRTRSSRRSTIRWGAGSPDLLRSLRDVGTRRRRHRRRAPLRRRD